MHKAVLAPKTVQTESTDASEKDNPRAGINNLLSVRSATVVQPRPTAPDMREPVMIPGSRT